ncbi:hypothetical protein ACEPAH_8413 [Sanghuangporus vaninii]
MSVDAGESYLFPLAYLSIEFTHLHTSKSILALTEVFDTFLDRSNGRPLHFHFIFSPNGPSVYRTAEHLLTALLKEQRQWKDIVLDLRYLEVSSSFSRIRITDTPIISSLAIHTYEMLCDIDKAPVYTHFKIGQSTVVRRLDLKGLIKLDAGVGLLTALKDCKLSFYDISAYVPMCMKILKSAPNLRHLTIDTDADFGHLFKSCGLAHS